MSGGGGTQKVVQEGDPAITEMNWELFRLFQDLTNQGASLSGLMTPRPLAMPEPQEQALLNRLTGRANAPVLSPLDLSAVNWMADATQLSPFGSAGFGAAMSAANPTARLDAATKAFETLVAPTIINQLTATGQARSGAITEALARGGTEMLLPILESAAQAGTAAGQVGASLAETQARGQLGAANAAQMLSSLLESRDVERINTALAALEAPRLAQLAEESRAEQFLIDMFLGRGLIPSGTGSSTTSTSSSVGPMDVITPLLLSAGLFF